MAVDALLVWFQSLCFSVSLLENSTYTGIVQSQSNKLADGQQETWTPVHLERVALCPETEMTYTASQQSLVMQKNAQKLSAVKELKPPIH